MAVNTSLYLYEYHDSEQNQWYTLYNKIDDKATLLGHLNLTNRYFLKSQEIVRQISENTDISFSFVSDGAECKVIDLVLNKEDVDKIYKLISKVSNAYFKSYGINNEEAHHF